MKPSRPYRLLRQGNLLFLRASIGAHGGNIVNLRLLLDTGASYTMLPVEALEAVGCDLRHPLREVDILTANGTITLPMVRVPWFHCLGEKVEQWPVLAHTLPLGTRAFANGLLGMDFLSRFRATIYIGRDEIGLEGEPEATASRSDFVR
jgi:predicted aspartyl protease